jgi:DNA-binding MarR family transcriptional regulator
MADPSQDVLSEQADAGMLAAMRRLHAAMERLEALAAVRLGMGRNDGRCLRLLAEGALTPGAIGARLGLTSGSVTALIDRLAGQGLVTRRRDPADRRGVLVERTPLAAARLAAVDGVLAEAVARLAARYGAEHAAGAARQVGDLARLAEWVAAKSEGGGGAG